MKKLSITLFLLPLSLLVLRAQGTSFYIGANGGGNLSKFKFTEDLAELYPSAKPVFGLNGGVTMGFEIQGFTLSTGLQYIQKGSKYETENFEDEFGIGFFTAKEKLHYLSVPLLVGYRSYMSDRVALTMALGPSFNVGLGGKLDETIEYFGSDEEDFENYTIRYGDSVNDDYRGLQMGFQLSPGLLVKLNQNSKLSFNVTWDIGLADSFSERYKNANSFFQDYQGNQLNRSTLFTIGYEYHFTLGDRY